MDLFFELFLRLFVKGAFHLLVWGPIQMWGFFPWLLVVILISLSIAALYVLFKRYKPVIEKLTKDQRRKSNERQ